MTTLTRRNPLATATDITLASETNSATALHYDYALVPAEHRSAIMLSARRIKDKAERTKRDILDIGKELAETKAKLEHGQFGDWLSVEFGMSERSAQRFMSVYETYGAKSDTVSLLNDSALYLLSGPSVPEAAREEVEQAAKTTGKSPTKAEVQQVIARHKPPAPSARFLTLDETEAALWRTAQHATGSTDRSETIIQRIETEYDTANPLAPPVTVPEPVEGAVTAIALPPFPMKDAQQFLGQTRRAIGTLEEEGWSTVADFLRAVCRMAESGQPTEQPTDNPPRTRSQHINQMLSHYRTIIDLLPDYGELTGDYSGTLPLRRALEPMIRKLEENL